MPAFLARTNPTAVPVAALWLSNLVIQAFLIATSFAEQTFTLALEMTSSMTLIPYLLVAGYGLRLAWSGDTYGEAPRGRVGDLVRAAIAVVYVAGMIWAGGMKFLLLSAMIYAPGTALYFRVRREQQVTVFTSLERLAFGGVVVAALAGVYGLVSGAIAV